MNDAKFGKPAKFLAARWLAIALALGTCSWGLFAGDKKAPAIQVLFSPGGGCTEAVVEAIEHSKQSVLVQAYSFTSAPIAKALVNAHKRRVAVQVILDGSVETEKYSEADFMLHERIRCFIDKEHAIAHNKVMVIDGVTVITGSFNFTKAAEEHNAENLLVIQDSALASKYADNWRLHLKHSPRYRGK